MILKAAHDGAEALVKSPRGHLLRTLSHVFVRVDVVLSARWLSDEEVKLMPMVNEMDWLNSAGMLTHFWKDAELPDLPAGSCANADAATNSSNGNVEFALEGDHADAILTADPAAKSDSHLGVAASAASPVSVECSTDTVLRGAGSSMYDVYEQALKHSHGYPVAHALHAEILETWRENTVG